MLLAEENRYRCTSSNALQFARLGLLQFIVQASLSSETLSRYAKSGRGMNVVRKGCGSTLVSLYCEL